MNRATSRIAALMGPFRPLLLATGAVVVAVWLAGCAHIPFAIHDSGAKGPATITGQVTSERGAVIADAAVLLASSGNTGSAPTVRRQAKTDVSGRFAFDNVPLGSYVVSVSPTGYKTSKLRLTVEKEGTARADLKVRM